MSDYSIDLGSAAKGIFVVYSGAGAPITGLVKADFAVLLALDGVSVSSSAVAISEVGNGRYLYSFTPTDGGEWFLLIRSASYNARGWTDDFYVTVTANGGAGVAVGAADSRKRRLLKAQEAPPKFTADELDQQRRKKRGDDAGADDDALLAVILDEASEDPDW